MNPKPLARVTKMWRSNDKELNSEHGNISKRA
jgi:hypothetical protein